MADDANIGVNIGARFDQLSSVMGQAESRIRSFTSNVTSHAEGLTAPFMRLNTLMASIAAAAAGFGAASFVNSTTAMTGEVNKLAKGLGITRDEASVLRAELKATGIETEDYIGLALRMERQVKMNESSFRAYGIATRDVNGHFLNGQSIIGNVIGYLGTLREGTDRNVASMTFFGRSIGEVEKLQRLNSEALQRAKGDVEELGLAVDKAGVARMRDYKLSVNELNLTLDGIKKAIGDSLLPVLTQFNLWFREQGPAAIAVTKAAIAETIEVVGELKVVLADAKNLIATILSPLSGLADAFSQVTSSGQSVTEMLKADEDMLRNAKTGWEILGATVQAFWRGAVAAFTVSWQALSVAVAAGFASLKAATTGNFAEIKTIWQGAMKEIEDASRDGMQRVAGFFDEAAQKIDAAVMARADSFKERFGAWASAPLPRPRPDGLGGPAPGPEGGTFDPNALKMAESRIEAEKTEAETRVRLRMQANDSLLALDKVNSQQFLQEKLNLQTQLDQIDLQAAKRKRDLYAVGSADWKSANQEMLKITQQSTLAEQQIRYSMIADLKQKYQELFDNIVQSFDGSIRGLIQGTMTWSQAWRAALTDMLMRFIGFLERKLASWLATEAAETTATVAGAATRTGAEQSSALGSIFAIIAKGLKTIFVGGAETSAGVAAAVAPVAGPAAPAIGLAAGAATVAGAIAMLPAAETGAWDIPRTSAWLLHPGEVVLPAEAGQAFRDAASGGLGGGGVTIQAWDARDVARWFSNNGSMVLNAARRGARASNMASAWR